MFAILILCLVVFSSTCYLTAVLRAHALRHSLLDIPNARSSHRIATPRGGGLSIVIVFWGIVGLLIALPLLTIDRIYLIGLLVACTLVAAVGFWDDLHGVSAKVRLTVHSLTAGGVLLIFPELPTLHWQVLELQNSAFLFCFYTIMLTWLLNLYNFMDGIDGIAGIEAISTLGSASLLLWLDNHNDWALLVLLPGCSVAGFLVWNWPPARIFMGDAGSGFLGFLLGLLALMTATEGGLNLWSWWILLSVFIVDASVTLITRIRRGDAWHEAHRSHAYQILSRRLGSHKPVTSAVLLTNVFWLLPWAYLANRFDAWAPWFCLLAMLPLLIVAINIGAGTTND